MQREPPLDMTGSSPRHQGSGLSANTRTSLAKDLALSGSRRLSSSALHLSVFNASTRSHENVALCSQSESSFITPSKAAVLASEMGLAGRLRTSSLTMDVSSHNRKDLDSGNSSLIDSSSADSYQELGSGGRSRTTSSSKSDHSLTSFSQHEYQVGCHRKRHSSVSDSGSSEKVSLNASDVTQRSDEYLTSGDMKDLCDVSSKMYVCEEDTSSDSELQPFLHLSSGDGIGSSSWGGHYRSDSDLHDSGSLDGSEEEVTSGCQARTNVHILGSEEEVTSGCQARTYVHILGSEEEVTSGCQARTNVHILGSEEEVTSGCQARTNVHIFGSEVKKGVHNFTTNKPYLGMTTRNSGRGGNFSLRPYVRENEPLLTSLDKQALLGLFLPDAFPVPLRRSASLSNISRRLAGSLGSTPIPQSPDLTADSSPPSALSPDSGESPATSARFQREHQLDVHPFILVGTQFSPSFSPRPHIREDSSPPAAASAWQQFPGDAHPQPDHIAIGTAPSPRHRQQAAPQSEEAPHAAPQARAGPHLSCPCRSSLASQNRPVPPTFLSPKAVPTNHPECPQGNHGNCFRRTLPHQPSPSWGPASNFPVQNLESVLGHGTPAGVGVSKRDLKQAKAACDPPLHALVPPLQVLVPRGKMTEEDFNQSQVTPDLQESGLHKGCLDAADLHWQPLPQTPACDYEKTSSSSFKPFPYTFSDCTYQGPALQGQAFQGPAFHGPALQGPALQGPALQGPVLQGPALQGPALQGNVQAPIKRCAQYKLEDDLCDYSGSEKCCQGFRNRFNDNYCAVARVPPRPVKEGRVTDTGRAAHGLPPNTSPSFSLNPAAATSFSDLETEQLLPKVSCENQENLNDQMETAQLLPRLRCENQGHLMPASSSTDDQRPVLCSRHSLPVLYPRCPSQHQQLSAKDQPLQAYSHPACCTLPTTLAATTLAATTLAATTLAATTLAATTLAATTLATTKMKDDQPSCQHYSNNQIGRACYITAANETNSSQDLPGDDQVADQGTTDDSGYQCNMMMRVPRDCFVDNFLDSSKSRDGRALNGQSESFTLDNGPGEGNGRPAPRSNSSQLRLLKSMSLGSRQYDHWSRELPDYTYLSLVATIFNPLLGLVALVCNHYARRNMRMRRPTHANNLYFTTIVVSTVAIFLTLTAGALLVASHIVHRAERKDPVVQSRSDDCEDTLNGTDTDFLNFFHIDEALFCELKKHAKVMDALRNFRLEDIHNRWKHGKTGEAGDASWINSTQNGGIMATQGSDVPGKVAVNETATGMLPE